MKKIIQWAMIGTGNVCEIKSGPGFYKAENSNLYALTNRTLDKAQDYAKRHNVAVVYENVDDMLKDEKIDAVYIATPPSSHKEYALKCAQRQIPCYIEKPVAMNLEEHLEIIAAFKKTNTKAFAAYYRRGHARFQKLKKLIDEGRIGQPKLLTMDLYRPASHDEINASSWRVQPSISGGGIFMDLGVHQLDIIQYILGPIKNVDARVSNLGGHYEPEDTISAIGTFENGTHFSANWCFVASSYKDEIEIIGNLGKITLSCFGTDDIIVETANGIEKIPSNLPEHVQQPLIQEIVNDLLGFGKSPSNLVTALDTARVASEILGGKPRG